MSTADITELAAVISKNTAKVHKYLSDNGLSLPSFDVNGPPKSLIPPEATDIEAARVAVVEATQQLRFLMLGPLDYLTSFTPDELISMQAITRFKIASCVPTDGAATFAEISKACGLPESDVKRLLRHATVKYIFAEPNPGVIKHNAVSRLLVDNQSLNDFIGASADDLWQAASQTVNAMVKYPGSEEPNDTGFSLANQTNDTMYKEFEKHPARAQRFGNAMTVFTEGDAYDARHVVAGYSWGEVGDGTVVDIGGSHGSICKALATQFPRLILVVQDLDNVIATAPKLDSELEKRIGFVAHDFFTPQSVQGADVYFLRWILHNWSDKYAIQILQNLIPALKSGARIVVNDNVLPPPDVLSRWREERVRSMDLVMKEVQNGKERELEEWKKLFENADPRFKFRGGKQPPGSVLWILELVWEP